MAFDISNSLRFDGSAYLTRTLGSAGNRKTYTLSVWVKRWKFESGFFYCSGHSDLNNFGGPEFFTGQVGFQNYNNGTQVLAQSTELFRDPAAWYNIVWAVDTTQGTLADRLKVYVNGSQLSGFVMTDSDFTQNYEGHINTNGQVHNIGARFPSPNDALGHFYLAEYNFIDGTALTPSSFGETKEGVWIPKDTSGLTFGTQGFRLQFKDDVEVQGFNTVLWEGNGGTQSVTGTGFSPDFVWIKNRDATNSHGLYDTVRGAKNFLSSDSTGAEATSAITLTSFDSDGFTLGSSNQVNGAYSYVAWGWDAGANNASTGHSSVIYEGSGAVQRISGLPFRPDLVWAKARSGDTVGGHLLFDSVRGATKYLQTNSTGAEATDTTMLTSFDSNGFVLGSSQYINDSGNEKYVAWAWDAGDSDPASNTNGTITSTVKTNGDFSIISYQGTMADANIGHGLSAAPNFLIIKNRNRSAGTNWIVQHSSVDISKKLTLNATTAADAVGNIFGSTPTAMDATKFYVGNVNWVNNNVSNENDHIAYAWRNVTGKQQFGKYTGNASSTGPTVSLGFRPGLVMIKGLDRSSVWYVFDTSRQPFNDPTNYTDQYLLWNSSNAEYTNADDGKIEITSTGFQVRASVTGMNASGEEYIYAAWAGSYSDFITDVNTTGDITSRVKANPTYGFSVVSYDGVASADSSTNSGSAWGIGHGLGATPQWVIYKQRTSSNPWAVYHSAVGATKYLALNTTAAAATEQVAFRDTAPTSTVINVGGWDVVNRTGHSYIAYCWSEVSGYSKFGSYTGNGSSTGPTVTLGFQPAWVIIKKTDGSGVDGWFIIDNTRDTDNVANKRLAANSSDAEGTDLQLATFSSTGFQITYNGQAVNQSGTTYIYAAFADTRNAAFWLDSSGNNNDFQHVNLDHNDTVADSPTNNFATFNPLQVATSGAPTFSDGNLEVTTPVSGSGIALSTIGVTSGKYFAEVTIVSINSLQRSIVGITGDADATITANTNIGSLTSSLDVGYFYNGTKFVGNVETSGYGDSYDVGDVIGIALNVDDSEVTFFKNGATQGAISFTAGGTYHFAYCDGSAGAGGTARVNFGQQPFVYGPPE
jgi:hypothetical protein